MYRVFGYSHAWLVSTGSTLGRRVSSDRGQGTVEYVGLILVVALLMAGVVAAMKGFQSEEGKSLAEIIIKKIQEAVNKVKFG